jgi:hypothetical protein
MILTKKNAKGHSNSKWIVKQARTNLVVAPAAPASVRKQCENATEYMCIEQHPHLSSDKPDDTGDLVICRVWKHTGL